MRNVILKIIILIFIVLLLSCTSEPKTSIKPKFFIEKENINFEDVKTNEIKIENIKLEAESNDKFTGEIYTNYQFDSTKITGILINDEVNFTGYIRYKNGIRLE